MQKCCISGVLHEGTPAGTVTSLGSSNPPLPPIPIPPSNTSTAQAYIANPSTPSTHAIIILSDVYGFTFPNTRLIADQFALNGYLTVIPDLFHGAEVPFPAPENFNLQDYIDNTMPRVGTVDPIISSVIDVLRTEKGIQKIGGVGYCFGGKYVCRWLKEGKLDAGYVAHPSFVEEGEVRGIEGALSIAAAGMLIHSNRIESNRIAVLWWLTKDRNR
jgi:dienelactone hydrolase